MNFERYIPVLAPMPPAVVIGMQLYKEVFAVSDPWFWWLAVIAAVLGTVGTIGAEMYAYRNALKAWGEGEKGAAVIAFLLALVVSGLIVWAVWRTDDSRPLVAAVMVAIVAYVINGIDEYMRTKRAKQERQSAQTVNETQAQIDLIEAQRRLANSQARLAAAQQGGGNLPAPAGNLPETFRDWRQVPDEERRAIASMSTAQIMARYHCSERTARNWRTAAQEAQ